MKKILWSIFLTFFVCVIFTASTKAAVITVCSSGCNSQTVQGGINLASNWDEVRIVQAGDYNESLNISKTIILTSNTTIKPTIFTGGNLATINITADSVSITNLNINFSSSGLFHFPIWAGSATNITIANNDISALSSPTISAKALIYFLQTNSSLIANNSIISLIGNTIVNEGIYLKSSSNNIIQSNNISMNGKINYGITLLSSNNNSVVSNIVASNFAGTAINLQNSSYNSIASNKIKPDFGGNWSNTGVFLFVNSTNNNIILNDIRPNGENYSYGIYVATSPIFSISCSNNISSNQIITNGSFANYGIYIICDKNKIVSNNISIMSATVTNPPNHNFGIYLINASNNDVESNMISTDDAPSNYGVALASSLSNVFLANGILTINNQSYGLYLENSTDNYFYDSMINATNSNDIFLNGILPGNDFVVNSTFNESDIAFNDPNVPTKLFVQYYLDILVKDNNSVPISLARVQVNDISSVPDSENPTASFIQLTNSSGYIPKQILTEFMANATYASPYYLYFSNYTIVIIHPSFLQYSNQFNLT